VSTEIIIDPRTGKLLSSCLYYSNPASWQPVRQSWYYQGHAFHRGFYGQKWYPGMVAQCTVSVATGWTNQVPPQR
jgi:hypothetical protein